MSQNLNLSDNLQLPLRSPTVLQGLTDLQADSHDNLDTFYDYSDSFSVTNNSIPQAPFVNALNTVSSASSYTQQYNTDANGQQFSSHFNPPNMTFDSSQPQVNQRDIFKFEIPGFEIIIRPKINQVMNLSNLNAQSHSSMDSYSPLAVNQNQNYTSNVDGNSARGSYANSVNSMNAMNIQNTYNSQSFTDNLQSQFQQQQNSFGFNNFHTN